MNSGGRIEYEAGSECRLLLADGKISPDIFKIDDCRSDRKGLIQVSSRQGSLKVHHRRVLPVGCDGMAVVIESAGKYRAICPQCNHVEVLGDQSSMECPTHGAFNLHWMGTKPTNRLPSKPKRTVKPKPAKRKLMTEPSTNCIPEIDLTELSKLENCELWTRQHVNFDHERVSVKAHALVYTGENPRKLCFNTYDGKLSKKKILTLPVAEFLKDEPVEGKKKSKPWYGAKDLNQMIEKLKKEGYVRA